MDSDTLAKTETRPARRKPESLAKLKKAARKLFVERGYHATRPQDIAREAGLGHGTFYLHYDDKRACFLSFVEDARLELQDYVDARVARSDGTLERTIAETLNAIYDYSETHPGVLGAAMTDEAVIDAEGVQATPLLVRWGRDWADQVRRAAEAGDVASDYDVNIIGQAILGAIHQTSDEGYRSGRKRQDLIDNVTRFLVRALRP
ncbi:MAG: TetR/AcrR family transcriptional regulator [Alphaproteobacteria bacterium]|nr:TetR/AcrR family transcriptional regulator [Alphaproteobacteria bacterium]